MGAALSWPARSRAGASGHFTEHGFVQDHGEGAQTFLIALRQDRGRARADGRGGRRRGHARAARREVYSGADELLHAFRRGDGNACRLSAGLSGFARLCPVAGTETRSYFSTPSRSGRLSMSSAEPRGRANISVTVHNRHGPSISGQAATFRPRFHPRVDRAQRCHSNDAVAPGVERSESVWRRRAGRARGGRPAIQIDEVFQNIEGLIALRIDGRLLGAVVQCRRIRVGISRGFGRDFVARLFCSPRAFRRK